MTGDDTTGFGPWPASGRSPRNTRSHVLDVLTALSDCRHETVENIMERRISGVSYMCWIDFHNGIWGCGFLCARLITLYFVSILSLFCVSLSGYHGEGYHVPSLPPRAITLVYTSRLPHQSYHAPPIHVHRVITPAISYSYFVVLSFAGFYATCALPTYSPWRTPHEPTQHASVLDRTSGTCVFGRR